MVSDTKFATNEYIVYIGRIFWVTDSGRGTFHTWGKNGQSLFIIKAK